MGTLHFSSLFIPSSHCHFLTFGLLLLTPNFLLLTSNFHLHTSHFQPTTFHFQLPNSHFKLDTSHFLLCIMYCMNTKNFCSDCTEFLISSFILIQHNYVMHCNSMKRETRKKIKIFYTGSRSCAGFQISRLSKSMLFISIFPFSFSDSHPKIVQNSKFL